MQDCSSFVVLKTNWLDPDLDLRGKMFFLERAFVKFAGESVFGSPKIYFWDLPSLLLVSEVKMCCSLSTLLRVDFPSQVALVPLQRWTILYIRFISDNWNFFFHRWVSKVFFKVCAM
uniref:Uncharacterized protein n=1 Tax=Lepeophtheirus salmonis TaxID=72036 RepID=A0A0K2TJ79_LEPSM